MNDLKLACRQLLTRRAFTGMAVVALSLGSASCRPAEGTDGTAGIKTAKEVLIVDGSAAALNRRQLDQLGAIIGEARVVVLGEPELGKHEPLVFRNRLFEYLVEEKGFTALAVEAAFPESKPLTTYLEYGSGTAEDALTQTRTWWHEPLRENLQLVQWMRSRNANPNRKHPVRLYAVDLSYTGPWGSRPIPLALEAALEYLDKIDSASALKHRSQLQPALLRLANPTAGWTLTQHDAFTAAIDDLMALFERERVTYRAAGSPSEYEWANRAAVVAAHPLGETK